MMALNWLAALKGVRLRRHRICKRGKRFSGCRLDVADVALQTEALEQRLVMDAAAVAAAQSALAAAESSLQSQVASFMAQETVLASNRQSALNTAAANHAASVLAANNAFDVAKQIMEGNLLSTLQGYQATFDGALTGLAATRDAAVGTADANFTLTGLIEDGIFAVQRALAEVGFVSAKATADATLQTQEGVAKGVYNGAVSLADSTLDGSVLTENAAYQLAVSAAKFVYNTFEGLLWNTYQNALLPLPGSALDVFQTNVAAAAATRDAIVGAFPNVNLDQYVMFPSANLLPNLQTANMVYQADVDQAGVNFVNESNSDRDDLQNAISGPGGATSVYETQLATAIDGWETAKTTAEAAFTGAMNTAKATYQNSVYGPSGAYQNLLTALASAKTGFNGNMAVAQSTYDGVVNPAKATRDTAVSTATQNFQSWTQTARSNLQSQGGRRSETQFWE